MTDEVPSSECLSSLAFDEWLAGEADAASAARYASHVAQCAACTSRREALERQHAAFLAQAPTWADHARLARRESAPAASSPAMRHRLRRLTFAPAAAALLVAAVALFAWRPGLERTAPGMEPPYPGESGARSKGAPQLGVYIKRGERVERGRSGARVAAGDVLRFAYTMDRPLHVALLGFDGRAAHAYFPSAGEPASLPAARDRALDFAVELDAGAGSEHFYGVFCPERFELAPLLAALQAGAPLAAPPACHVEHLELHKEAAP